MAFRTQEGTLIAESDGKTLTVSSNYFCFETDEEPVKASGKKLLSALEKAGINMKNSVYDS